MYMAPKKKPNLQQQKTKKREQDLIKLNQKADLFRQSLITEKLNVDKINENIDIKNCLYSI
jgi:hypothetical protein